MKNIFAKKRKRDAKHKNYKRSIIVGVIVMKDEGYFREISDESVHYS